MRVWLVSIVVTLLAAGHGGAQSAKATGVRLPPTLLKKPGYPEIIK